MILGAGEEAMQYSEMFKRKMVQRMTGPQAMSATALSRQVDISQSTLSKWLRQAGIQSSYIYPNSPQGEMMVTQKTPPKSPKDWKAEEKLKIVLEAQNIPDDQLGAFLRTKGIHETHLQQLKKHYPNTLPIAVVYYAGFSEKEKVVKGHLADIFQKIENVNENRLGMVIVGRCLEGKPYQTKAEEMTRKKKMALRVLSTVLKIHFQKCLT
jgi:hypothetical protein